MRQCEVHESRNDRLHAGEDFPVVTSTGVLSAAIRCAACGDAKPAITLGQATDDETADFVFERPSRRYAGARG